MFSLGFTPWITHDILFFFFNLSDSSKWKFIICVSPSTVGSGVVPDPWLMEAVVSLKCGFQGHSGSLYLAGRQRINEHDVSCGKSLWARPTSEMYHFPPLSIFVVLKTEQTKICVAKQKPNHFSLVFCLPSLPWPFNALKGCSLHISSLFLCYIISAFHLFFWKWSVYHKLWKPIMSRFSFELFSVHPSLLCAVIQTASRLDLNCLGNLLVGFVSMLSCPTHIFLPEFSFLKQWCYFTAYKSLRASFSQSGVSIRLAQLWLDLIVLFNSTFQKDFYFFLLGTVFVLLRPMF